MVVLVQGETKESLNLIRASLVQISDVNDL